MEQFPTQFFDARTACGDAPGVDVDQVGPTLGQFAARAHLDHRRHGQPVGRASARGEHMQVHAGGQLQGAADKVAGRGGAEDQALAHYPLARAKHALDGAAAGLDDRPQRLLDDIGQAAFLVARRRIGAAVGGALLQVAVVPVHFTYQGTGHLLVFGARGQHVDGVAHLGHFREQHGGAGAYQQVGCVPQRRVGGDARERIAATALHAKDQFAGRYGFAAALVELLQAGFGQFHDLFDHFHKAQAGVLQAVQPRLAQVYRRVVVVHHLAGLQLFTAEADDQRLATQVGVARQVAHGADRNVGIAGVDGHATAITMGDGHHVIDVGVLGQQFAANALDRMLQHAGHALHGGGDTKDVAGADGAVGVAVAFEREAFERRQRLRDSVAARQAVQLGRGRHGQLAFLHPAALAQVFQRVADDLPVAAHGLALGDGHGGHLVALRHAFDKGQAVGKAGAFAQAAVVDHHHDVIVVVQADVAGRVGMFDQLHVWALLVRFSGFFVHPPAPVAPVRACSLSDASWPVRRWRQAQPVALGHLRAARYA